MSAWLPITVIAAAQIISRLISIASVIWRERARAASACARTQTAASVGAMLAERLPDGTASLIIPMAACGTAAGLSSCRWR